jgi:hypothetical protein
MKTLKLNKRRWDLVHRFEDSRKRAFLNRLTFRESFEIFCSFYRMADEVISLRQRRIFNKEKIDVLRRTKSLFKKVKSSTRDRL